MHLLPSKKQLVSFTLCTLVPSVGLPLVVFLSALMHTEFLGFIVLQAYVWPPFLLSEILGARNHRSGGTYGNALFEGYIGLGPTLPLGLIFCVAVWFAMGYILWLLGCAAKSAMFPANGSRHPGGLRHD